MSLVYLFTPGDSRSKLEKAASGGADAVIVDLEDGVAADGKAFAREQAFAFLDERRRGGVSAPAKPIYIRCNPAGSPHFGDDLRLVRESGAAGAMLAKCESADELRAAHEAAPDAELIPLIETARGVSRVEAIVAAAVGRIRKVAFGAVDFALDIGADWSVGGEERLYAMGRLVLMSRVAGLMPPIDAVFPLLDDERAFAKDAELGKRMGFSGKMVVHPRHIDWVRVVYRISGEELAWCREAVRLYENAQSVGAVRLDGRLIDLPVYLQAKRKLGIE